MLLVLKLVEFLQLFRVAQFSAFDVLKSGLLYVLVAFSLMSLFVLLLYVCERLFSAKISLITSTVVFYLFFVFELGLTIYANISGSLLGVELVERPLPEMLQAVNGVVNISLVFALLLVVGVGYVYGVVKIDNRAWKFKKPLQILVLALVLGMWPFVNTLGTLTSNIFIPSVENFVVNKSLHCLQSCLAQRKNADISAKGGYKHAQSFMWVDSVLLKSYIDDDYKEQVVDLLYPLERVDDEVSTLAPYFVRSNSKPNIVVLVVESLGREMSGETKLGVSFTPFLDSLAQHALYWPNGLSTTRRSFGAVPAITGSLPHGPRGFQFGNMPAHNSLISILRSNGYCTNAFYASDFTFDGVYEYLLAQGIDHISSQFKQEAKDTKNKDLFSYWGYHDAIMFRRSLQELGRIDNGSPMFNLFITITAHDDLNLRNQQEQIYYLDATRKIISQLAPDKQKIATDALKREASIYYTDCALRSFFAQYSSRPDFDSTIFIITGDHASGVGAKNKLGFYHVPVVIWSKMLTKSGQFPSLVTHNDITPSVVSLLRSNFNLSTPQTVHWVGKNLSTQKSFCTNNRMLFLEYAHEIDEMLYNGFFYSREKNLLCRVDSAMNLIPVEDEAEKVRVDEKMDLYRYVNSYVYLNNKLTKHPIYTAGHFEVLIQRHVDSICCKALEKKPSEIPPVQYHIMTGQFVGSGGINKIRLSVMAEIMVEGDTYQDHQMDLVFRYDGNGKTKPNEYKDKIIKFTNEERVLSGKWYRINIQKEFDVRDVQNVDASVFIRTHDKDEYWRSNTLYMRNIDVLVEKSS